jgi:hypothetical protein
MPATVASPPLTEPVLVVRERAWLGRRLRRAAPEHELRDGQGRLTGFVSPVPSRRLDLGDYGLVVADAGGATVLTLRASVRRLFVCEAGGREVGLAHNTSAAHASLLTVVFCGPPERTYGDAPGPRPELGALVPREPLTGAGAGGLAIATADGLTAARISAPDGRRITLALHPAAHGALRRLAVAFACSLVDPRWLAIPSGPSP